MSVTADFGASVMSTLARALGAVLLAAGLALALMFAFAAAAVIGLIVLAAALAMHFAPKRRARADGVLEARRTPNGWVVETAAWPKS
jgi:hypothetical protein